MRVASRNSHCAARGRGKRPPENLENPENPENPYESVLNFLDFRAIKKTIAILKKTIVYLIKNMIKNKLILFRLI